MIGWRSYDYMERYDWSAFIGLDEHHVIYQIYLFFIKFYKFHKNYLFFIKFIKIIYFS